MEKLTLFYLERPDIKISMQIYFNLSRVNSPQLAAEKFPKLALGLIPFIDKNQLYFDGHDMGKSVEEVWGDSDYEYIYTIEPEEVNKFYKLFTIRDGDKSTLLQEIQNRFSVNKAYSLFGEFMRENNIKFSAFTWT